MSTIIIVLGMHRSGTSLVSSVLHTLGVPMCSEQDCFRSEPSQPYGYWEDQTFNEINRSILKAAGGHWHNPPEPDAVDRAGAFFGGPINALINQRCTEHNIWGFKDPRMCLTARCWMRYMKGHNVKFIHVHRPHDSIADSLLRRGEKLGGVAESDLFKAFVSLSKYHEHCIKEFFVQEKIAPEKIFDIRFNELVHEPIRPINLLAEFLQIKDEKTINLAIGKVRVRHGK